MDYFSIKVNVDCIEKTLIKEKNKEFVLFGRQLTSITKKKKKKKSFCPYLTVLHFVLIMILNLRLDSAKKHLHLRFTFHVFLFLLFFFLRTVFHVHCESRARRESKIMIFQWVSCTVHGTRKYFIHKEKKNFKTGFHNTIHTFKIYFVTMFSVFCKINDIQTNPKQDMYV